MLEHLKVSNVALIEEAAIDFAPGLNIVTGETGAGKSILIDSINFVLGGRVSREFIRAGAETATVEAYLTIDREALARQIAESGVDIAEDGALLVHRSHNIAGRGAVKINGKPATIGMLRDIAATLIDLHGQHEHQSLLNPARHILLLDRFCQENLEPKFSRLSQHIAAYKLLQKNISALSLEAGQESQAQTLKFQIEEIAAANLVPGEEEGLVARRKLLLAAEKISLSTSAVTALLGGDNGALDSLSRALEYAEAVANLDESKKDLVQEMVAVQASLEELSRDFSRYADSLEHSPQELEEIESRLEQLYRLKQKYNRGDVSQILEYFEEASEKLSRAENSREELERLGQEKKALEKEIGRTCLEMSKIRREAAKVLEGQIEAALKDLGMEAARFAIDVASRSEFGAKGFDQVNFLFSANKGEELKPLAAIASGGEMSRVMLALKTALAGFDTIETFIFDEIDAGISGRTAQQVAQKMADLAKNHQILCITHLPQIAAMGDANFYIEKTPTDGRTVTVVQKLSGEGVIASIARLIGGAEITGTTTLAAKEMRRFAEDFKKQGG